MESLYGREVSRSSFLYFLPFSTTSFIVNNVIPASFASVSTSLSNSSIETKNFKLSAFPVFFKKIKLLRLLHEVVIAVS
jgi:hypothetical protein